MNGFVSLASIIAVGSRIGARVARRFYGATFEVRSGIVPRSDSKPNFYTNLPVTLNLIAPFYNTCLGPQSIAAVKQHSAAMATALVN